MQFLHLIEAFPEPLLVLRPDGRIVDMNPACAHALGMNAAEASRRSLAQLATEPPKYLDDCVKQWLSGAALTPATVRLRHGDGRVIAFECEGARCSAADASPFLLLRLRPANTADKGPGSSARPDAASVADGRADDAFFATLAHELRNLLAPIQFAVQLLRMPGTPTTLDKSCSMIERQAKQLAQLADEVSRRTRETTPAKTPNATAGATDTGKALAGLRVLVIEDESLVAMLVEDMLDQLGCIVVETVSDVQRALDRVARSDIDFALLDVGLRGQLSYGVAEALEARGVPFLFMSGAEVEERWRDRPSLMKPFELDQLRRMLERALGGGR